MPSKVPRQEKQGNTASRESRIYDLAGALHQAEWLKLQGAPGPHLEPVETAWAMVRPLDSAAAMPRNGMRF